MRSRGDFRMRMAQTYWERGYTVDTQVVTRSVVNNEDGGKNIDRALAVVRERFKRKVTTPKEIQEARKYSEYISARADEARRQTQEWAKVETARETEKARALIDSQARRKAMIKRQGDAL